MENISYIAHSYGPNIIWTFCVFVGGWLVGHAQARVEFTLAELKLKETEVEKAEAALARLRSSDELPTPSDRRSN